MGKSIENIIKVVKNWEEKNRDIIKSYSDFIKFKIKYDEFEAGYKEFLRSESEFKNDR